MRRRDEPPPTDILLTDEPESLVAAPDEPPVVARLVVEIRSDGTRTIARGAMEDLRLGERVAVKAEGTTPLALAGSLMKALLKLPMLPRVLARAAEHKLLGKR